MKVRIVLKSMVLITASTSMVIGGTFTWSGSDSDGGGLDMGYAGGEPEIEINAVSCQEGSLGADDGVLDINADFRVMSRVFHFGPSVFQEGTYPPLEIQIAPGVTLSFPSDPDQTTYP